MPRNVVTESVNFDAFTAEVVELYRATRKPRTATKMMTTLNMFARQSCLPSVSQITTQSIVRFSVWLSESGRATNTKAGYLGYLRAACKYARRKHYLRVDPFDVWGGFVKTVPTRMPKVHSMRDIGRVLALLASRAAHGEKHGRLHAVACVLAYTGMRREEALGLHESDLQLKIKPYSIDIWRDLKCNQTRRQVPCPDELAQVLLAWMPHRLCAGPLFPNRNGRPWSQAGIGYRPGELLKSAGEEAGILGFVPKSLRTSYGTYMAVERRVMPAVLQQLMGHTDIKTTMKYYVKVNLEQLSQATAKIAFPNPKA
jgi:integrase